MENACEKGKIGCYDGREREKNEKIQRVRSRVHPKLGLGGTEGN